MNCAKCGNAFEVEHDRGRPRKYCDGCRKKTRPLTGRIETMRDCRSCGTPFLGHARGMYCSAACKQEAKYVLGGLTCRDCGKAMQRTSTSVTDGEARCRDCRGYGNGPKPDPRLRKDGKHRGSGPQTFSCGRCGDDFTRPAARGQVPKWCAKCKYMAPFERRRAREKGAFVAHVNPRAVFEADGWRCHLCGKKVNRNVKVPNLMAPTVDHVIPLNAGGTHEPANARCAHFKCNSGKRDRGGGEQMLLLAV